jgi:hypothetical protein
MLTKNLDVTYAMVWVIVLSNIIAVSVSFMFLNQLVRLTYLKATLLVPFLMVLTAFGAYTAHNSLADILLMLAATVVGIAAIRWDWPRAPLLLALVLGDIAERYLFLSYSLYEWSWLTRPLVIAFAAVTVAGVVWPLIRGHVGAPHPVPARADLPITIGFLVVGAWVVFQARAWPFRTAVFPLATGSLLAGLALLKLGAYVGRVPRRGAEEEYVGRVPRSGPADPADLPDVFATASRAEWLAAVGWMAGFFLMLWLLGALVTVPLFAVVYLLAVSRQSPVLAGSYALVSWVFIYGLFDRVLHIPLPAGALLARLGELR